MSHCGQPCVKLCDEGDFKGSDKARKNREYHCIIHPMIERLRLFWTNKDDLGTIKNRLYKNATWIYLFDKKLGTI